MAKRTVAIEQYYTSSDLAKSCVGLVESVLEMESFSLILEPSAGGGAFLEHLPDDRRVGIDIEPAHSEVTELDFFQWFPPFGEESILTIGNPPFGQRGALATRFLDRACEFSDAVAFILPRSYNKYTFQNRVNRNFHLLESVNCDDFELPSGEPVSIKAVFQIWEKRDLVRELILPDDSHPDFTLRHAHLSRTSDDVLEVLRAQYDITIPQVGADFSPRDPMFVTKGSHWFVRLINPDARERFDRLNFDFLDGMNVAHKSLSKRDIVTAYRHAAGETG